MMTDTEIRVKGWEVLSHGLGEVEAEKFVFLLMKESFDYTEWQKTLFEDRPVREISSFAMKLRREGELKK